MPARRTSAIAYRQIEEEGLLSRVRLLVYIALYRYGPATAGELAQQLSHRHPGATSARLGELRDRGVAMETQERVCKVTGRNVIEWDVTEELPVEPSGGKAPTKKEVIAGLEGLLDEVATWLAVQEDGISSAQAKKAVTRIRRRMAEAKAPKI